MFTKREIRAFRRKTLSALIANLTPEELSRRVDLSSSDLDDAVQGFPRLADALRGARLQQRAGRRSHK